MPNSSRYFSFFPSVTYQNKSVVDITRRTKIFSQLYNSPTSFLSYTIKDGERPEEIALYYYNDMGKVWLVFLANDIIDPVSQWPLSTIDFDKMIIAKYGSFENATSNIKYYENVDGLRITKDTYDLNSSLNLITSGDWTSITTWEYEYELNEKKRDIFLFNNIYANQAESELKEILSV
jgi:hypothetical protein